MAKTNPWTNKDNKFSNPRRLAGRVLRRVLTGQGSARDQLDWTFHKTPPKPKDTALITELVYGTMRHMATIDLILSKLSKRPLKDVDEGVLIQLRMGAFQWLFLDRIPPHAIVHEAVELIPHRGAKKFANGILRSLGRLLDKEIEGPQAEQRARWLPINKSKGWLLKEDLFPSDQGPWLAAVTGLPWSHVSSLIERFGFDKAEELCHINNQTPCKSLRINRLKTNREQVAADLKKAGFIAEEGNNEFCLRVKVGAVERMPGFLKGHFSIQDETAQKVAPFLDPQEGHEVLDLCAAPGGKTMHLAEWMGGKGRIVATDGDPDRLPKILKARQRLGHDFVEVVPRDKVKDEPSFDRVLLDVPCSNTGVIRRRVELRHRLDKLDRKGLKKIQAALLREGLGLLKKSGVLVYSTCSIDKEENEELVASVLAEPYFSHWVLDEDHLSLMGEMNDGGYMARIKHREN